MKLNKIIFILRKNYLSILICHKTTVLKVWNKNARTQSIKQWIKFLYQYHGLKSSLCDSEPLFLVDIHFYLIFTFDMNIFLILFCFVNR